MGSMREQSRVLTPAPAPALKLDGGQVFTDVHPLLEGRQTTKSYRTSSVGNLVEGTPEDEFLTVTRNGFQANTRFDSGHPFHTTKTQVSFAHPDFRKTVYNYDGKFLSEWWGPLVLNPHRLGSRPNVVDYFGTYVPVLTEQESTFYGGKAVAATIPTSPQADTAVNLAELLREGLPTFLASVVTEQRVRGFRSLGDGYLETQFGWLPFIGAIQEVVDALRNANDIVFQYVRDSGRLVRRRWEHPAIVEGIAPSQKALSAMSVFQIPGVRNGHGLYADELVRVSTETLIRQRIWFSGAYMYGVAVGDDLVAKLTQFEQLSNKLLGTRVTPEVLWNLAPWSWLVDWISTLGQTIGNLSAFANDELVMHHGYLMRETISQVTVRTESFQLRWNNGTIPPSRATYRRVTKERVKASPFGFALKPSQFTGRQWSILAALGLTQSRRVLP